MRQISFVLILTFLLFACASSGKYDKQLNQSIGDSKTQLVEKLGRPSAVKILPNGDELLAYTKVHEVYIPSEYYLYNQGALSTEYDNLYTPFLGDYDFTPAYSTLGYDIKNVCQTVFLIQKGIVTGWKWRGNDCTAL